MKEHKTCRCRRKSKISLYIILHCRVSVNSLLLRDYQREVDEQTCFLFFSIRRYVLLPAADALSAQTWRIKKNKRPRGFVCGPRGFCVLAFKWAVFGVTTSRQHSTAGCLRFESPYYTNMSSPKFPWALFD